MDTKAFFDKQILLVIDGFKPGGSQQVYLLLISEYVKIFNKVILVVLESTESDLNLPKYENFQTFFLNSRKIFRVILFFKLKFIFLKTKPSFIFASMYRSQVLAALAKPLYGKLLWVEQNTYLSRSSLQWNLMKLLSRRCSRIINTSAEIDTISRHKISQRKSILKPNPINTLEYKDSIACRENDFIFIGRMVEQKNPLLAIRGFASFLSKKINSGYQSRMHFVGDGHLLKSVKILSVELGIDSFCIFHGSLPISDTLDLLSKCKTLISCSFVEGFGLARLEALGVGCCVVTTNTGGVKNILSELSNVGVFIVDETVSNLVYFMEESLKAEYWSQRNIYARVQFAKRFEPKTISYEWLLF